MSKRKESIRKQVRAGSKIVVEATGELVTIHENWIENGKVVGWIVKFSNGDLDWVRDAEARLPRKVAA